MAATILEPRSARIFEFNPDGKFVKEIGKNLYSKGWAHAVRVDNEDNIWLVDNGTDEIVKLGPDYRVKLILGRRNEPVGERVRRAGMTPAQPVPPPRPGYFYEPTDVAFDAQGNIFISDGYQNSSVHKFDKDGHIVKLAGSDARRRRRASSARRTALPSTRKGNVYVADRSNARIQVLDNDLNYVREIKYEPPSTRAVQVAHSGFRPRSAGHVQRRCGRTRSASRRRDAVHLHARHAARADPEVHARRQAGRPVRHRPAASPVSSAGSHALSCVSENEIWTGELLNWRVQKFTLQPGGASEYFRQINPEILKS